MKRRPEDDEDGPSYCYAGNDYGEDAYFCDMHYSIVTECADATIIHQLTSTQNAA